MNVWWCLAHKSESINSLDSAEDQFACWLWADADQLEKPDGDCRMIRMRLVPADALVIEKVEGEWPESARDALKGVRWRLEMGYTFNTILDALAQASQVGETGGSK